MPIRLDDEMMMTGVYIDENHGDEHTHLST